MRTAGGTTDDGSEVTEDGSVLLDAAGGDVADVVPKPVTSDGARNGSMSELGAKMADPPNG